jgi:hypothetical protein
MIWETSQVKGEDIIVWQLLNKTIVALNCNVSWKNMILVANL